MSLSPVTGTEVPETANGVVTPVSSGNGRQTPASGKRGESRVPCSGDLSEDTGACGDVESRVHGGDGSLEVNNHKRTSGSTSLPPHVIDDSETCPRDILKDSDAAESPGASPLGDPALWQQRGVHASSNRSQTVTERLHDSTEEEDEDGEKEKQDEEEDEKNDNKWIQTHAGGRTEAEVGELSLI